MVRFNSSGYETDKRQKIMNTILIVIFAAIVICSTILLVVRISKIDNNNIENNQINTQNSVLGAEKKLALHMQLWKVAEIFCLTDKMQAANCQWHQQQKL